MGGSGRHPCPKGRLCVGGYCSVLETSESRRDGGVGGVESLAKGETCWSRFIKEADDIRISGMRDRAGVFIEPIVVGGAVPELDAFRDGFDWDRVRSRSQKKRRGVGVGVRGYGGVSHSDKMESLLAMLFPLSRISLHMAVTSVM